jgi:superfamily II DNA or RNA helicase/diadenosine tetraphosphate (Ap4A) HIT family hydrolase
MHDVGRVSCPFCSVDPERVVLDGPMVFAIADQYPVSPGHTLVIPRRHVATYFEATADERAALWDAVEAVKARLDAELRPQPDGYNVGFNVGEAAGQTVMHLHVHVIPRFFGDHPNPRGGVRGVIPHKADYTASEATGLVDLADGPTRPLEPWLLRDLAEATRVDIAVAFVWPGGVERIMSYLEECLERGGQVRIVTGDYGDTSDPAALRRLLDLREIDAERAALRIFETAKAGTSFHPKAYLVSSRAPAETTVAYVGSSNLSRAALSDGHEWNVRVVEPGGVGRARAAFDTLFMHPATCELDDGWIDRYARRRAVLETTRAPVQADVDREPPAPPPTPHEIQEEALAALCATREAGNRAGLVVLATGLGKTWLSAFDSEPFGRVLFVAHREEILRQALATYRAIRPGDRLGLFTGKSKDAQAQVLFASIQTLARPENLERFDARAFDYIVIDEFHHADARTYRRIIRHFEPEFLLGLTATPERTDGGDLLALCDENLVYRCDLGEGIRRDRLAPFHYFGVPDLVDYANIPWRSRRFDEAALTEAVETTARAHNALEQWRKHGHGRTLGFCVSQRHADFMRRFFAEAGLRVASVHAGPTSDSRSQALERLERGELDVLFAVDMFNEGLDVRNIETVLMLRPTESKILWLQQIGRGLRKAEDKDHLRIIDYIGNHRVFLNKPAALLEAFGLEVHRPADIIAKLAVLEDALPPGCAVTYELEAMEVLGTLVPNTKKSNALSEWYIDFRERTGVRPTALEAFQSGYNPRSLRAKHGAWLRFVDDMGDLDPSRQTALRDCGAFLGELETTEMTRSYEMVLIQALLWLDALPGEVALGPLTAAFARVAGRSAALRADVSVDVEDAEALRKLLVKNPIAAWTGRGSPAGAPYFVLDGDQLRTGPALTTDAREALVDLVAEIVQWRLAEYLSRLTAGCRFKVLRSGSGKPILKIDRRQHELPTGWVDVDIDGQRYEANFVKEYVNVVRKKDEPDSPNALPTIMHEWFGPDAGKGGTKFMVSHAADTGGGYAWTPVRVGKPTEGRPIVDDHGKSIDARYRVETDDEGNATIVLMSRGGGRNNEYTQGFRLVLQRLAAARLVIDRIEVASSEMLGRPAEERLVTISGAPYPLHLAELDGLDDLEKLRKKIGRGIAAVGRAPNAKGSGNANKRVRIWVSPTALPELARILARTRATAETNSS